jgi:hypothetical protein
LVRRQESRPSGDLKPVRDPYRTAAFRETAHAIVHKDRADRRSGMSVDTAGTIARALEHAYAQGFAEARQPPPARIESLTESDRIPSTTSAGPIEWMLIPPRPRNAFWTICLFTFGRQTATPATASGHLVPTLTSMGRPGWRLVTRDGMEEQFGRTTILPLLRLGLLGAEDQPEGGRLVISALGRTTWQRFVERGGQFPDDLTTPSGEDGAP